MLRQVDTSQVETVVVLGADLPPLRNLRVLDARSLDSVNGIEIPKVDIEPWDLQSIVYTSGTTGAVQGRPVILCAPAWRRRALQAFYMLTADDRYMCNLPLFHVGGTIAVTAHAGARRINLARRILLDRRILAQGSGDRDDGASCCSAR